MTPRYGKPLSVFALVATGAGIVLWQSARSGPGRELAAGLFILAALLAVYTLQRFRPVRVLLEWGTRTSLLYWLIRCTPESARFTESEPRTEAVFAAERAILPRFQLLILPAGLLAAWLGWQLGRELHLWLRAVPETVCFFTVFALLSAAAVAGTWLVLRPMARRQLRTRLIACGVPICLRCGYDLTGNVSGRCPECGAAVQEETEDDSEADSSRPQSRP